MHPLDQSDPLETFGKVYFCTFLPLVNTKDDNVHAEHDDDAEHDNSTDEDNTLMQDKDESENGMVRRTTRPR